jgi:hypothetical protein
VRLFQVRLRVVRLDAGYWGLRLIAWIHTALRARAVLPWNPKRQKRRDGLPPTWTAEELGKRTSIKRFFGRTFIFFRLQRPPVSDWSAVASRVALTYAALWVIALAAYQAGRASVDPFSPARAGVCVGGHRGMNPPSNDRTVSGKRSLLMAAQSSTVSTTGPLM